jgi:hypothetical protein
MLNYVLHRPILINGINDYILTPSFSHSLDVLEVLSSLPLAIQGVISLSAPFISSRRYREEGSFPSLCTTTATVPTFWHLSRCTINSWAVSNCLNYFCEENRSVIRSLFLLLAKEIHDLLSTRFIFVLKSGTSLIRCFKVTNLCPCCQKRVGLV